MECRNSCHALLFPLNLNENAVCFGSRICRKKRVDPNECEKRSGLRGAKVVLVLVLVLERIAAASFFCRDDQIHDPYIHARTHVRAPPRPQATCGLFRSVVDTRMPRYERATELKPRIFPKKQNEMKLFSMIFPSRKIFCQSTKNWLRKGSVTSLCNTFFETRCGNQTFWGWVPASDCLISTPGSQKITTKNILSEHQKMA